MIVLIAVGREGRAGALVSRALSVRVYACIVRGITVSSRTRIRAHTQYKIGVLSDILISDST